MSVSRRGLLLAAGLVAASSRPGLAQDRTGLTMHPAPKPLPEAGFAALGGGRIALAQYRGRAVLLNAWATWCPPCVAEMPSLDRLAGRFAAEPVAVIGASLDFDVRLIAPFQREQGLQHLLLVHDDQQVLTEKFLIGPIPTTILIGASGQELGRFIGDADWDTPEGQEIVRALLRG